MEFKRFNIAEVKSVFGVFFTNGFIMASLISLFVIGCVDNENLIKSYELTREINALNEEKEELMMQIETNKQKIRDLQNDKASLEKFAREEYFMKKKDEVIFIVK